VVLAEYGPIGVQVSRPCRRARVPFVVHFHGYDAARRDVLAKYAASYRTMFTEAAAIIAVSRAMEHTLRSLGCPPDKIVYNPCGTDCEAFGNANPGSNPPTFVAVGRFVEKKSPDLSLRAFVQVVRERPAARLRMIGDGPLREMCQGLARELGCQEAVTLLGAQPHDVVIQEMRAARAFVQHSVVAADGDSEGTPVAILEAGAAGLPVVATRHAGIPDVVVEGETGLLVDEHDVTDMARHMLRLVDEPQVAETLGRQAA
jgi:colanic acid/amylovoran biosynthesis glycosyltransferase